MFSDRLGVIFSSLCLCHCLVTPLLILLLGTNALLGTLEQEWVHKLLLLPVFVLAAISLPKRYMHTRNRIILLLSVMGICGFTASLFFHGSMEILFTVVGSVGLISAHLLSIKLMKQFHTPQVI
jgi:hypothetical protein